MVKKSKNRDALVFWKFLIIVSFAISLMNLYFVSGIYDTVVKDEFPNLSVTATDPFTGYFVAVYSPLAATFGVVMLVGALFYFMWKNFIS